MPLKVGLVIPHIFMQNDILPDVIFSPAQLALELTEELTRQDVEVTLFTAGPVTTSARNITADLSGFKHELQLRGDTFLSLLKKHPLTFITLAREAQASLIAKAYEMANNDELDVVHVYTNEEDIGLHFARFCKKPAVFTFHDPFSLLAGYRSVFPKYKDLNWLSISNAQRRDMPEDTNWVGTIYNALNEKRWPEQPAEKEDYVAFFGRIIESKGTHLAIEAVQRYNESATKPLKLKIAGKHYADGNDSYWRKQIEPLLTDPYIEYVGYIHDIKEKQSFLGKAKALIVPSIFAEPFGMVLIEALASSTPLIGLDSGAIPEVIKDGETGFVVKKKMSPAVNGRQEVAPVTTDRLAQALAHIDEIKPSDCRQDFLDRFTMHHMTAKHKKVYQKLTSSGRQ